MMIFFKERLAYLAVPKTGSTAIETALDARATTVFRDPPGMKHSNALKFERKIRPLFERGSLTALETVAMIREPISWLGSWFRYRSRAAIDGHKNSTAGLTFDQFIEAYLRDDQPDFAKLGSQSRFLSDQQGDLLVDHLFSYDDMPALIAFLEHRLDCKIALPEVNVSPEVELILSDDLNTQLRQSYQADFQLFDALRDGPLIS